MEAENERVKSAIRHLLATLIIDKLLLLPARRFTKEHYVWVTMLFATLLHVLEETTEKGKQGVDLVDWRNEAPRVFVSKYNSATRHLESATASYAAWSLQSDLHMILKLISNFTLFDIAAWKEIVRSSDDAMVASYDIDLNNRKRYGIIGDIINGQFMKEQEEYIDEAAVANRFVRLKIDDLKQHGQAIRIAVADGGIAHGLPDHTLLVRQSRIEPIARAGVVFEVPDVLAPEAPGQSARDPLGGA